MSANTEYYCYNCKKVIVVYTSDIFNSKDIKVVYNVTFDGEYKTYYLCPGCYVCNTKKRGCIMCNHKKGIIRVTPNNECTNIFKLCKK